MMLIIAATMTPGSIALKRIWHEIHGMPYYLMMICVRPWMAPDNEERNCGWLAENACVEDRLCLNLHHLMKYETIACASCIGTVTIGEI
jgi:hypothetical protein